MKKGIQGNVSPEKSPHPEVVWIPRILYGKIRCSLSLWTAVRREERLFQVVFIEKLRI